AGRLTVRHHHPHRPRRAELADHLGETRHVTDLGVVCVADNRVAGPAKPFAHVATHAAQAYEAELHDGMPPASWSWVLVSWRSAPASRGSGSPGGDLTRGSPPPGAPPPSW